MKDNRYTISAHLGDTPRIEADEVREGLASYSRLHVADIVFFTHDPDRLQRVARAAMASALRLRALLDAAAVMPGVGTVTDADVDAALAPDALPPREEWTSEQEAAADRIAGAVS